MEEMKDDISVYSVFPRISGTISPLDYNRGRVTDQGFMDSVTYYVLYFTGYKNIRTLTNTFYCFNLKSSG